MGDVDVFTAICEFTDEEGLPNVEYRECVSKDTFDGVIYIHKQQIAKLNKRIEFLESDAVKQLEAKLEQKRIAAKVVYEWLGKFADHETLGKSWCGWLDDSYGTVYRIWKD